MKRESKNRLFLAVALISILVIITGCDSIGYGNNVPTKYFTGYNSVEMSFLQDSPPSTFFYDSQAAYGADVNTIPIFVQLNNLGSSDSYGALFVSGFDPLMIAIQGYTNNYPGYTGTGQYRPTTSFQGYFSSNSNFAASAINIPLANGNSLSLGVSNFGGQSSISFSSSAYPSRTSMFQNLGFTSQMSRYASAGYSSVSPGVISANVGAILNPITMGMFNTYGWGDWLKKFQLEGRNTNNPGGGMDVVEFPATLLQLPTSLEEFQQPITVTSCFDYATHATAMVCIDPEPYSNVVKVCRASNTVSVGAGQGAPVAITSVEQRPAKGRTTFVINIHHNKKNAGDMLYDYFSLYKCDPASGAIVKTTDLNVVYVGYVYLSNELDITMNCMPDQVIRLDSAGNGQITCSIQFPPGMAPTGAYKAPLEVELWYGYSKTIYRNVIIRKV